MHEINRNHKFFFFDIFYINPERGVFIGNYAISSSKKHQEKTDQDWCNNSNKCPSMRSSKINT